MVNSHLLVMEVSNDSYQSALNEYIENIEEKKFEDKYLGLLCFV